MKSLDDMSLNELKILASRNNQETCDCDNMIVVLERGFVFYGSIKETEEQIIISNAFCIRNWGTTRGLGELAESGPTKNTKLDFAGTVVAPKRAVIFKLVCKKSSLWKL